MVFSDRGGCLLIEVGDWREMHGDDLFVGGVGVEIKAEQNRVEEKRDGILLTAVAGVFRGRCSPLCLPSQMPSGEGTERPFVSCLVAGGPFPPYFDLTSTCTTHHVMAFWQRRWAQRERERCRPLLRVNASIPQLGIIFS